MSQETAVPIINGMVESLGGTSNATTVVPALKALAEVIGVASSKPHFDWVSDGSDTRLAIIDNEQE